jgi:hypothetical protein
MANKLTTLGYFRKRLRDCGYNCIEVYKNFNQRDSRIWTIIIDPGNASIFCTCYVNKDEIGDSFFELYDGGQFIPSKLIIQTSSIEVITNYLTKLNITGSSLKMNKIE